MSPRVYVGGADGHHPHTVIFRHWLPRVLGADATTVGSRIYVRGDVLSAHLHAHEYLHVRDYRRYGVAGFLVRYVGEGVWRVLQQLARGNWRTTFKRAHNAHSLEQRAELFARAQAGAFRDVRAGVRE